MKIYYAHHIYKYNTPVEEYELNLIKRELPQYEVLNPNGDIQHEDLNDEQMIMMKCLNNIIGDDVAGVVFSSMSGVIGKGVYDEVNCARLFQKEIYYIHNNKIARHDEVGFQIINESRRIYAIVR